MSRLRILPPTRVRAFYDRFGARQDSQAFYEDPAVDVMLAAASLDTAHAVLEFGCGTGRLAARLLRGSLPPAATYTGVDLSPVMVQLARGRLAPFGGRATVVLTDGAIAFPCADGAADRVLSAFVLDLLSEDDIRTYVTEARRVLPPAGRLCLVSLTVGRTPISRVVSALCSGVHRLHPALIGGCRPIRLAPFLPAADWAVECDRIVTAWGVPSEVLVASRRA